MKVTQTTLFTLLILLSLPAQALKREYISASHRGVVARDLSGNPYAPVKVCWGWSCKKSQEVPLTTEQWDEVASNFLPQAATPQEERVQIRHAIALMEQLTGEITGTSADLGAPNSKGVGLPGQMDCVDESTNTSNYLRYFEAQGLLTWHRFSHIQMRFNMRFNPFAGQHFTAVVFDKKKRRKYAIDSWWDDNGVLPIVQRLSSWKSRRSFSRRRTP